MGAGLKFPRESAQCLRFTFGGAELRGCSKRRKRQLHIYIMVLTIDYIVPRIVKHFMQIWLFASAAFAQSDAICHIHTCNVLGKRAGHASERVKIPPTLTSTIDYTSKIGDIGKKQVAL